MSQKRTYTTDEFLSHFSSVKLIGPKKWQCACPAHDDKRPSGILSERDDGSRGISCLAGCNYTAILKAAGLPLSSIFNPDVPRKRINGQGDRIVATYDYTSEAGELLYQVCRMDPKDFRQRKPDGNGGWIWQIGNTRKVLYRLPELLASSGVVYVVEGEKDVDNLRAHGLTATCNAGGAGAGKWRDEYAEAFRGRDVIIIADKDVTGRAHAETVSRSTLKFAAAVRIVEVQDVDGKPCKDVSDYLAAGGDPAQLASMPDAAPFKAGQREIDHGEPIILGTDEHRVTSQVIQRLGENDLNLFSRGPMLVSIVTGSSLENGIKRPDGAITIRNVSIPNIRDRITRSAELLKASKEGDLKPAHPPGWLPSAILERGEYHPHIRQLVGISDHPVLRSDGTIAQEPGYDVKTGILYTPSSDVHFPTIPDDLTAEDAESAAAMLLDPFQNFPFEAPEHRAAFLASLLSMPGRSAYTGPTPLFLIDANVRGAGKSLLAQAPSEIAMGRPASAASYAHDDAEMRKLITSLAIAGDRSIVLDNVVNQFGNGPLDAALTATNWRDRILGRSEMVDLPLQLVWFATANNCQVSADTTRRIIHIRLDTLVERPEERTGFKYPDLIGHIRANRGPMLAAALTILAAFIRAGRPQRPLTHYGSFEGWSNTIRQAVVWCGLPDPCLTRQFLIESADSTHDTIASLLSAWEEFDPWNQGIAIADLLQRIYKTGQDEPGADAMRNAIESLAGTPPGKAPSNRVIGNRFKSIRRRVVSGRMIDIDKSQNRNTGSVWKMFKTERDSRDSRDSVSAGVRIKKLKVSGFHTREGPVQSLLSL